MLVADAVDFLLGPIRVDVAARRLLLAATGERLLADTQQVDVLICLIRAYPKIVSKDELIEQVWGGRYVTDAALHKTVSMLRKLLRDHHGTELIETRYRRGYQLTVAAQIAPAEPVIASSHADAAMEPVPAPAQPLASQPAPRVRAIAMILAAAALVLIASVWWLRPTAPPTPAAVITEPAPPEPALVAALGRLDEAGLIQSIKDALGSDPAYVTAATAELRRRAGTDGRLLGLADKYEGIVAYRDGDFAGAQDRYQRALGHFRAVGERQEQANVLNNLGVLLAESGAAPERAEAIYRESLALRIAIDDRPGILGSHRNLSNLLLDSGRLEAAAEAVAAYEAAAELQDAVADRVEARILRGDVLLARGGDAAPAFESALALATEAGLAQSAASASQRIGRVALRAGDPVGARRAFERALDLYRQSDNTHQLDIVLYNLATAVLAQGERAAAVAAFQAVLDADPHANASALRVDARLALARLQHEAGQSADSDALLATARQEALVLQSDAVLANVLMVQADLALRDGGLVAARGHLEQARERLQSTEDWEQHSQWRYLDLVQRIASGQASLARADWQALLADAQAHGDRPMAARIGQLGALLAMAEGNVAAAYRAHAGSLAVLTDRVDVSSPPSISPLVANWWPTWLFLALLIGTALGWQLRRSHSKPSANTVSG